MNARRAAETQEADLLGEAEQAVQLTRVQNGYIQQLWENQIRAARSELHVQVVQLESAHDHRELKLQESNRYRNLWRARMKLQLRIQTTYQYNFSN